MQYGIQVKWVLLCIPIRCSRLPFVARPRLKISLTFSKDAVSVKLSPPVAVLQETLHQRRMTPTAVTLWPSPRLTKVTLVLEEDVINRLLRSAAKRYKRKRKKRLYTLAKKTLKKSEEGIKSLKLKLNTAQFGLDNRCEDCAPTMFTRILVVCTLEFVKQSICASLSGSVGSSGLREHSQRRSTRRENRARAPLRAM